MFRTFVPHTVESILDIVCSEPKVRECYIPLWGDIINNIHKTNRADWDEYIPLWRALKLQSKYNSPIFTSHSLGHSMKTAYFMHMLLIKSLHLFNLKSETVTNMVLWTGLLHDVGYAEYELCQQTQSGCEEMKRRLTPFLDEDANQAATGLHDQSYHKQKFLHAQLGANLLRHLFARSPRLFLETVQDKILEAVREHNADNKTQTRYDPSEDGTFMSLSNVCIQRHYKRVNLEHNPLLALLRIGDNLDMSRERLTPDQRTLILVYYQKWFYTHPHADAYQRKTHWARLHTKCRVVSESQTLDILFKKSQSSDFLFTYSSWIIEHISISEYDWNKPYFEIRVDFFRPIFDDLRISQNWYEGIYQLRRLYDSLQSIYVYGTKLSSVTFVNILLGTHPLREIVQIKTYGDYIKYAALRGQIA